MANHRHQLNILSVCGCQKKWYNRNANSAASAASMRAAGNGGSFGGNAAIANQKYYEQAFVPAQLSLNTNKSQDLANAQTNADNRRATLEGQLASLDDTIAQAAQNRYYNALEADRQYELQQQQLDIQKQQAAAQNAYNQYLLKAAQEADKKTYIGNDDYRGWLNYLAKNGNSTAAGLLNYAGNDGGVSNRNAAGAWLNDSAAKISWVNAGTANDYYYKQWLNSRE